MLGRIKRKDELGLSIFVFHSDCWRLVHLRYSHSGHTHTHTHTHTHRERERERERERRDHIAITQQVYPYADERYDNNCILNNCILY